MKKKELVIVGGGSGGTILANSVNRKKYHVTLIDKSGTHVFQPEFLYIAVRGSKNKITKDERSLLDKSVNFVKAAVTEVDLQAREVKTSLGKTFKYDFIAIATGIKSDCSSIPGLAEVNKEFGDYHTSISQAKKVWDSLNKFKGGTIALGQSYPMLKCPPSPLEGILLIEELMRKRGLRDKTKLVFFTPYPRAYPAEAVNEIITPMLKERGIKVMTFFDVEKIDTVNHIISSIEGDSIKYDLPIIVPPSAGVGIKCTPDSVIGRDKLLVVDKYTMRIKGFDNAFALGDGASLPTAKSGVDAHLEAKTIAKILDGENAKFNGRTHCPFDTAYNKGTFVIGSYDEPVVKYPVNQLNLFMKHMMAKIYWASLKGTFDPIFDIYFKETEPSKLQKRAPKTSKKADQSKNAKTTDRS